MNAVQRIMRALEDEGPRPDAHRAIRARHTKEWPVLWQALEALVQERRSLRLAQTFPRPVRAPRWAVSGCSTCDGLRRRPLDEHSEALVIFHHADKHQEI